MAVIMPPQSDCSILPSHQDAGVAQLVEQRFRKPTRHQMPLVIFNGYKGFSFISLVAGGWRMVLYSRSRAQLWAHK